GIGIGASGAGIAGGIGVAGIVQADQVAGVGDVGVRGRESGAEGAGVAAGGGGQGAVGHAEVGAGQPADGLAEGDGDGGCFAGRQSRVGHHDAGGRAQGVDGVGIGIGAAAAGVAGGIGVTGVVQADQVAGVLDIGVRREGGGPGDAAVAAGEVAQGAAGHAVVPYAPLSRSLAEGDGDGGCFAGR